MKKTFNTVLIFMIITAMVASAQTDRVKDKYLSTLPTHLKLKEDTPQRYKITADYFNGDIFGKFMNKTRVTANYTRGFNDDTVKWNNVEISSGDTREGPFVQAAPQAYMENFSYKPSAKMLEASSFSSFPPNSFYAKNMIWDMLAIESFAWSYFDSLRLNQLFRPAEIKGEIRLAGASTFNNRDVKLQWIGISQMNGDLCALIDYRTFDNPLTVDTEQIKIKGRSHYWGTIWVSLEDKQIEHATLYEDVVMDMQLNGQRNQLLNTVREIVFEKLN